MSQRVQVVQFGMGPIGTALAREVLARPELELVGAVDRSADLAGRPLVFGQRDPCLQDVLRAACGAYRAVHPPPRDDG